MKKAGENFVLHKRAQPKASDLRENVRPRPAGGLFANWERHHAAVNWEQAQPAAGGGSLHKRAQPKASDLRENIRPRPAGGLFANWVQAQPAAGGGSLHKRAQPKASDLRESVRPRPAGGPFANWERHHAAVNWEQAQPGAGRKIAGNFFSYKKFPKLQDKIVLQLFPSKGA